MLSFFSFHTTHSRGANSASRIALAILVALLAFRFALRVHHPISLPFFMDEYRHISRAQLVYMPGYNPIEFAHGKLLLYYWLGLFAPQRNTGSVMGRLSIAIASLITAATSAAIARRFFGRQAAIFALAFYALAPMHYLFPSAFFSKKRRIYKCPA